MVIKMGKYGKFLACPGYPECKNTKAIVETIDEPCPKCGGTVQVRKAKNKRKYYICENDGMLVTLTIGEGLNARRIPIAI